MLKVFGASRDNGFLNAQECEIQRLPSTMYFPRNTDRMPGATEATCDHGVNENKSYAG